jgi:hypothetical protein
MRSEKNVEELFDPFSNMHFEYDRCFLCGVQLEEGETAEHVFPKWLQRKFDLWNQRIILLNGTGLPYKQLTIPCCVSCNGGSLSRIEREIETAYSSGFQEFKKIDSQKLFQWMGKIYYGILFKELSLDVDRRDPSKGKITSPDLLEKFKTLHLFLQSIRRQFEFEDNIPWSIFVVELSTYGDKRDFDYFDNFVTQTFALRMGNIGVIAHLQDNGIHKESLKEYYDEFDGIKLNHLQFNELVAKAMYNSTLLNRTPKYITVLPNTPEEPVKVISLPLQGLSTIPVFDDWIVADYAKFLTHYLNVFGVTYDQIYNESLDKAMTWLKNEDGTINQFEIC